MAVLASVYGDKVFQCIVFALFAAKGPFCALLRARGYIYSDGLQTHGARLGWYAWKEVT